MYRSLLMSAPHLSIEFGCSVRCAGLLCFCCIFFNGVTVGNMEIQRTMRPCKFVDIELRREQQPGDKNYVPACVMSGFLDRTLGRTLNSVTWTCKED